MCAYLKYGLSKISSLDHSNIIEKLENAIMSSVPTLTEASKNLPGTMKMTYKSQYPSFSDRIRRREDALNDLQKLEEPISKGKKQRGRKPKKQMIEQKRLLDDLRRKRRRKVNMMHTEVSEYELIENMRVLIQIIRNLSFVKVNEHQLMKCNKLVDIIITLFVECIDKEITYNCLDILTSLAKHIILKETPFGQELVKALFESVKNTSIELVLDECME